MAQVTINLRIPEGGQIHRWIEGLSPEINKSKLIREIIIMGIVQNNKENGSSDRVESKLDELLLEVRSLKSQGVAIAPTDKADDLDLGAIDAWLDDDWDT